MQGGIHPDLPGSFYFDLLDAVKAAAPDIHIHAFSPMEVLNGATKLGISFREFLQECRRPRARDDPGDRGRDLGRRRPVGADEGQAARRHVGGDRPNRPRPRDPQLVDDHVRARRRAAALGFPHPAARADPTRHGRIHRVRSAAVRASERADLPRRARRDPGPTFDENRRMHAVARILLDGVIHNVQVSWVKMGVEACQTMLNGGANDFGGTLMEETISRMAGAEWGIRMEPSRDPTTRSRRSVARPSNARPRTNACSATSNGHDAQRIDVAVARRDRRSNGPPTTVSVKEIDRSGQRD